jgi:large subunit ribosomal protein L1
MSSHGKKYVEAAKLVERNRLYRPEDAVRLVKETSATNFDATVEVHIRLGIDPRHADQQVRSTAVLPNGTGKEKKILVFAAADAVRLAEEAGADYVGSDDLVKKIEDGWLDFDVALATPDQMGKVGKLGRILGRRGLMPNPKSGTIAQAQDMPRVIQEVRKGKVEFRNDKTGLLHVPVGKVRFPEEKLLENFLALIDAVVRAKPTGSKGVYVKTITLTSTMGPGIAVEVQPTLAMAAA